MYKVLVVDDEPRQVKAMSNIIKQLRPEYEVFVAVDGQEALDFIAQNPIDILLTDIRMPFMDGLQLIEKLWEQTINLKIVILSGYGDFEYAQKAIHFGVFEYLVKPIGKSDIDNMLKKIEQSIKTEQEEINQKDNLIKKLDNSLPVYIQHLLNKWVYGELNENELSEIETIFPFKGLGTVIITHLSKYESLLENFKKEEVNNIMHYLKYSMKEVLNSVGHSISFFLERDKGFMVTVLNTKNKFDLSSIENAKKMNNFIINIKNEYDLDITIGIGSKSDNIFLDIRKCFEDGQIAARSRFFYGLGKVIEHSKIFSKIINKPFCLNSLEELLSEAINHSDRMKLLKTINDVFENAAGQVFIHPQQFKEDLAHIILNISKKASSHMLEENYNSFVSNLKSKLIKCEEHMELRHCVDEVLLEITDILNNKDSDRNSIIIQKCKKFIEENYTADLSLELVAQKYHFNSSYFSNLFKTYTGIGFSEYLLKERIQKATQLLKNTDCQVAKIANTVGFKDATYFNRMFKRELGVTPNKYRQMPGNV